MTFPFQSSELLVFFSTSKLDFKTSGLISFSLMCISSNKIDQCLTDERNLDIL